MTKKNIVLIGFMGSGKTFTAREISKVLKRKVYSTDVLIEKKEKTKIRNIFASKGEAYFRKQEAKVVSLVSKKKNAVIDCGGGVILNPDNIKNLKKSGVLVYLRTSATWIYKRIKSDKNRPLVNVKNPMARIKYLLNQRRKLYAKADVKVKTDGRAPKEVALEILKLIA